MKVQNKTTQKMSSVPTGRNFSVLQPGGRNDEERVEWGGMMIVSKFVFATPHPPAML